LLTLGPCGGARIGAVVARFSALMTRTRQAIKELDDLGDSAATIGVSAEYLQEIRFAMEQLGVPLESVDGRCRRNVILGKVGLQRDNAAVSLPIPPAVGWVASLRSR
jgi:hypothetical protein